MRLNCIIIEAQIWIIQLLLCDYKISKNKIFPFNKNKSLFS